jgi:hypothetical protein
MQKKNERVRVDVGNVINVYCNGECFLTEKLPGGAEVIGNDGLSGQPLAWSMETSKKGRIIFLGLRWSQAMREHERMLCELLELLGLRPKIKLTNPNVWASLASNENHRILYLMNLLSSPMETQVEIHPNGASASINLGYHNLSPMSVKIIET